MSNLKSALEALQKALDHARKGKEFYSAQVQKLEKAIATIEAMAVAESQEVESADINYGSIIVREASKAASKSASKPKQKLRSLPRTGQEFWLSLITEKAKPPSQILSDAINALGIDPTDEDRKKLANRLAIALFNATKAKQIKASGPRHSRLYSK